MLYFCCFCCCQAGLNGVAALYFSLNLFQTLNNSAFLLFSNKYKVSPLYQCSEFLKSRLCGFTSVFVLCANAYIPYHAKFYGSCKEFHFFFYNNIFTHICSLNSTATRHYLFSMSGSKIKKEVKLENENVKSHGFIDFYFKKSFIKPFDFEKKFYGSVHYISVT